MKLHTHFFVCSILALLFLATSLPAQNELEVSKWHDIGLTPPTPIVISGFSGEVARVLDLDLTVMGFKSVPAGSAQYVLTGSSAGNVAGRLALGQAVLFSKNYNGGSLRAQAHRLADDVVFKITGVKGIAETKIAFKGGEHQTSEIFVSDFDGYNRQQATRDGVNTDAPSWVPGRLALYYTSYKMVYPYIFYQDLTTGARRNFAHFPGMNSSAAVSRDGRVAMVLSKNGNPNIYVCDSNGDHLRALTDTTEASSPCWSPDGRWICYAAKMNGRRSLFKVSPEGGEVVRIPTSGILNPSEPDWSPDGKWIVFTSMMGSFSICVVPAEGGSATILTGGEDPSWSPNSRTLVFVRRGGGMRYLSLLDVPTKQVKDVSRVSGIYSNNSQPSWAK